MNTLISRLLALPFLALLWTVSAHAAITPIAQVPLLNISGTGSVKPNLMLLFDNSGSMNWQYTPDYIVDNLCRTGAALSNGTTSCQPGHPPFMSADFNKQYYNPRIRYQAPIKWDSSYYADMTAANTKDWTAVPSDGYGKLNIDLYEAADTAIDLTTEFPDLTWCRSRQSTDCQVNTGYGYPDATYNYARSISGAPYYYNINIGEYCKDDKLTDCKAVNVGANPPTGYTVPARVRWCTTTSLTTCRAKRAGTYVYPKFSTPPGAALLYGTLAIGASTSTTALEITSVSVKDATGRATVITNAKVAAATGSDTPLKQQQVANAVAASIIAGPLSGTQGYWACLQNPLGSGVPNCSLFGITLSADNVVAVIPVDCIAGAAKNLANCTPITDNISANARNGWILVADAKQATSTRGSTGLIRVTGTATGAYTFFGSSPSVASVTMGSTTVAGKVTSGFSVNRASVAADIVKAINDRGTSGIAAYAGGNSATSVCAAETATTSTSTVCIVSTALNQGTAVKLGSTTNYGNIVLTPLASVAAIDATPVTTTAFASGTAASGTFIRVDILPGLTFPKVPARTDCVAQAGACSYSEEMTNFANWYAYYKSRLQMMKTSVGLAFAPITSSYRVGLVRLSEAGAGNSVDMKPSDFTSTARSTWYSTLYNMTATGGTPVRAAMDNVGKMFANQSPYQYSAGQEVVQQPCQQNFLIVTTDGYWNGATARNVGNNDNVESPQRFCTAARGCVDTRAQSQPSIADVALHWYNGGSSTGTVSLRPDLETDMTRPGLVPAGPGENTHLHMSTYTLGLGVDGVMTYEANYDTAPKTGGDFYNLITSVQTGCPWNNNGAYVWPNPDVTNTGNTVQERVDDLWHAAINGHGKYFSASEPKEVVDGLTAALEKMQVSLGAASAAATSTPNISLQDNDIFSDTFTTVRWYGELANRKIDPSTGEVNASPVWTTTQTLGKKVAASTDTRKIKMATANGLQEFLYANMTSQQKAWFDNRCGMFSQCSLLSAADRTIVNGGANLVNWLRGQQQYADDERFRAYTMSDATPSIPIVLGDIASSKPAYVRDPRKTYAFSGYDTFKSTQTTARAVATVFTAANDGMLHAFRADTGEERWAYVPAITMSKLHQLASVAYATNHIFTADGAPETADIYDGSKWRTILVAGLNAGGRGYYALDVTDPTDPKQLWELCADSTVCAKSDPNLGLSFGNPQFGRWNGKWVVFLTSGYNNVPGVDGVATGDGKGYLYIVDALTGTILKSVTTAAGDVGTPSGLAKITAITADPASDPDVTYIYGGDNQGQMWRFDLTNVNGSVGVLKLADAGALQPITTRPDVTLCAVDNSTDPQRVVLFGTGRLLDVPDTTNGDTQSLYLVKDTGSTVQRTALEEQTLSLQGSSTNTATYQITDVKADLKLKSGWYFDWKLNRGERMNIDPKIVSGVANVVTNIPTSSSSCSVGGTSNAYAVDVCNGTGVNGTVVGSTLSNTSAAVGFIIVRLPSGQLKMITTTAKGETLTRPITELDAEGAHPVGWRRVKGD